VYAAGEIEGAPGYGRFLSVHDDYGLATPAGAGERVAP
jgi:hypothetical protein